MRYLLTIIVLALSYCTKAQEQNRKVTSAASITVSKNEKHDNKGNVRSPQPISFDKIAPSQNKMSPKDTIPWNKLQQRQVKPLIETN